MATGLVFHGITSAPKLDDWKQPVKDHVTGQ